MTALKSIFSSQYAQLRRWLIDARSAAGISQTELAARLGKHQSFVSKYELGERRLDFIELILVLEEIGADISSLLEFLKITKRVGGNKSPYRGKGISRSKTQPRRGIRNR